MKSWKEESWGGRIKLILFALTPAVVLLVIAEVGTSTAIRRKIDIETDSLTGRQTYVFHVGGYPWSHRSRTPLNTFGFGDEEFLSTPKGNCTHVVFAGDSYTFGDGVDRDRNWVSLVKAWANRQHPERCLRFFNIGVRNTTIEQQARYLEATWDILQPDVVILGQYQNDLTDQTKGGASGYVEAPKDSAQRNWLAPEVHIPLASLVSWMTYQAVAIMTRQGIHYDLLGRWSVLVDSSNQALADRLTGMYASGLDSMVTRVRSRGASFGVIIFPSKFDLLAGYSPEEKFFLGLARDRGLPALSVLPAFDQNRDRYPFLRYDGHLNQDGNVLVAREVIAWLFQKDPAPFPALRGRGPVAAAPVVMSAEQDSARVQLRRSVWLSGFAELPGERLKSGR